MAPAEVIEKNKLADVSHRDVYEYWNAHTLGLQYARNRRIETGTREFFDDIRPWMSPYKFPWMMRRIEREAKRLKSRHLLEIGCGMGFVSVQFMKRGVRVTATDLTESAIDLASRHFELERVRPVTVRTADALNLPFPDAAFDAVWSNGVLHTTGDTQRAVDEVHRVLKPGGRAIISHFYRRPSWMHLLKMIPGVNIEFEEQDPPVNDFYTEREVDRFFRRFEIVESHREHYRMLPVCRSGWTAIAYNWFLKPAYNSLPEGFAKRLAYKYSVVAVKKP